ncbi:hypothetical protein MASR1M65_04600 [Saprospiraceae bacterium]
MQDNLTYPSIEKLKKDRARGKGMKRIPGDVLEFGVALGGSGIVSGRASCDTREEVHRVRRFRDDPAADI